VLFLKEISAGLPEPDPASAVSDSETPSSPANAVGGDDGVEEKTPTQQPGSAQPYRAPVCPQSAVLELWAKVLPELPCPTVQTWHRGRRELLTQRWRELAAAAQWPDAAAGLERLRVLFAYVRESRLLMGRVVGRNGRAFVCSLQWLLRPENWARFHEGEFHPQE